MGTILVVIRAIWAFFTSKLGVVILGVAAFLGAEYALYSAGRNAEKKDALELIATANKAADKKVADAEAKYKAIADEKIEWQTKLESAVKTAREGQQSVLDELRRRLATAESKAPLIKTVIKEVPKYVTQKADSSCSVPAGFVWLYDYSLQTSPVPDSGPSDVDASSGVAISAVATVAAANNAECAQRGQIIEAWQYWYAHNSALWQQVQDAANRK